MTERERGVVAVGGSIVLAAVLVLRVLPWIAGFVIATEARLRDRVALLGRARAEVAESSGLRDSAERLSHALVGVAPEILGANSAPEATAELSGLVNLVATREGATLDRVEPIPDSADAGWLHRAAVRATLMCDVRGLVRLLTALAFGKAALNVRDLRVTAVNPLSAETNPEVLEVDLTVTGWFLGGGSRTPPLPRDRKP